MKSKALLAAVAAPILSLTLAACQPTAEAEAGGGEAAAAGDAATPAAATTQADASLREGLWQTTMSSEGMPDVVARMCVDAGMTALSASAGQQTSEDCTQAMTQIAGGMTFTSRCAMGASGTMTTEGSLTGDLQTGYRMEATTTTEGASVAAMNGTRTMTTEALYQGACPEGWRGGDMEIPGMGARINIHDMQGMAEDAAEPG